jgi:K+-sensing histidine kinase KdpD
MFFPHWFLQHRAFRTVFGILISTSAAAILTLLIRNHARNWMPLGFVLVVLIFAQLFGPLAGMLSSVVAAVIFATWLYAPHGDLTVQNAGARASLGWMILAGTSLSFLLAPAPESRKHR